MRQIESFLWGIIAALGALFVQLIIFIGFTTFAFQSSQVSFSIISSLPQFIIAFAFIEETFKYIIISRRVEIYSLERSFIINALFVGAGFAALEFLLLANIGALPERKILIELATIHLGTSGLMGYLVAIKNPKKIGAFLYATILATIFHAGYNLLIEKRDFFQNYIILFLLALLVFFNLFNLFRIKSKLA